MKIPRLRSNVSLFIILLQWSNNVFYVNASFGVMSIASGGMKIGEFLWNLQDLSKIERVTLVNVHTQLKSMESHLESVIFITTYLEKFKAIITDLIAQTERIDTDFKTTLDYLKIPKKNVNDKAKSGIVKFAEEIITGAGPDLPFKRYDSLRIDVSTKLIPALRDFNKYSKGQFTRTCSLSKKYLVSLQQMLLDLLKNIKMAELKVFLTLKGSAKLLGKYDDARGSYKLLVNQKITLMKEWFAAILADFRQILREASRDVWRCDPEEHKEGWTYTKLYNVFQKFVVNEMDLGGPDDFNCYGTCASDNKKYSGYCHFNNSNTRLSLGVPNTYETSCDLTRKCAGKLHDCESIYDKLHTSILGHVTTCHSLLYDRRYDMIANRDSYAFHNIKQKIGPKTDCDEELQSIESRKIPKGHYFTYCQVCFCTCDDNTGFDPNRPTDDFDLPHTFRFFYNKPVFSNFKDNYVITGIRWRQSLSVWHIQIEQGKLLNEGVIDQDTASWKANSKNDLHDSQNHIELEWSKRSVELQDIEVPTGHVLVGLQLVGTSSGFKLRIFSKPFDFASGIFSNSSADPIPSDGKPISSDTAVQDLILPDATTRSTDILTNQRIDFTTSDFITDIGQTTIPYLDIQDVKTTVANPMGGAGLYYKYKPGNAGFLALKLISYDVSQNLVEYDENSEVNFTILSTSKGNTGIFVKT